MWYEMYAELTPMLYIKKVQFQVKLGNKATQNVGGWDIVE